MPRFAAAALLCLAIPVLATGAQTSRETGSLQTDQFAAVRCGEDVIKALVGKTVRNGRVVEIETAHRDIRLKNTGGSEVNDSLFSSGWAMCGDEYQLLEMRGRISDAVRFPSHSRRQPGFLGTCTVNGKALTDHVLAVLDNPSPRSSTEPPYAPEDTTPLRATAAWRIGDASGRFVPLPVDGLRCPRGGIFTIDGGM